MCYKSTIQHTLLLQIFRKTSVCQCFVIFFRCYLKQTIPTTIPHRKNIVVKSSKRYDEENIYYTYCFVDRYSYTYRNASEPYASFW